jgi:hypothetical protein
MGLSSDSLTSVARDSEGRIWFGTATQGVSIYDPRDDLFTPFTALLEPIASDRIRRIVATGDLMLVFSDEGFAAFRGEELVWVCVRRVDPCELPTWTLRTGVLHEGEIWLGGPSDGEGAGGIVRLDPATGQWVDASPGLPDRDVRDLEVYGGTVWVASAGGVASWDGASWLDRSGGLPSGGNWQDLHAREDTLWVAGGAGVYRLVGPSGSWEPLGTWSPPAVQLQHGPRGRLWAAAGSAARGATHLDPSEDGLWEWDGVAWRQHRVAGPDWRSHYRDLALDGKGRLWAALAERQQLPLLSIFHQGNWQFIEPATEGLSLAWTLRLLPDGEAMWLGHCCCTSPENLPLCGAEVIRPDGVAQYEEATNVWDMARDDAGRIWFASFSEASEYAFGLSRLDPSDSTWIQVTTRTQGAELRSNRVRAVAVQGRVLWIGYASDGASRWDLGPDGEPLTGDDEWVHYDVTDFAHPLLSNQTTRIAVGRDRVWIGSTAGLSVVLDTGEVRFLGCATGGLPACEVRDILPLPDGGAWVALREGGIARVRMDRYGEFSVTPYGPPELVHPDVEALEMDTDGVSLWIGTAWGLARFHPPAPTAGPEERPGVYPNPFRPGCHPTLRLLGISGRADGVVLDTSGRRVARFSNVASGEPVWDGRIQGRPAPPGLYMIRLRTAAGPRSIPVAILSGDCGP